MRRYSLTALTFVVSLFVATSAAQAVVVDMNALGQTSIAYNQYDRGGYFGVALVPTTGAILASDNIPAVASSAPCVDPALSSDLVLPSYGLCAHGGPVMHNNETFALAWDPLRRYFSSTKNYVETFLRDVADGSGTFTSPYAVTSQYTDSSGRAANASLYGGACTDFGSAGKATCDYAGVSTGYDYPVSGCPVTGTNFRWGPFLTNHANEICLTDAQLKSEIATMITRTGVPGHTKPGFTPLLVLLTPPGVETCLDAAGTLCSANGNPPSHARFCSYHSQVAVGPTEYQYVVQPWTAETGSWIPPTPLPPTWTPGCDEPDATPIPVPVDVQALAIDIGQRLVSPLSQGQIGAIVNPALNGWFALNGAEINDNGCIPLDQKLDNTTVGSSSQNPYLLQREFNNAGVIETDPNALACTDWVNFQPRFVVPSAVNQGDVVDFDGTTTISTLIVPRAGYVWEFGDGKGDTGPTVAHSYAKGGTYNVKLTVTDRGGNVATLSQTITVLDQNGQPVGSGGGGGGGGGGTGGHNPGFLVHLQLMPQSLRTVLRSGVAVRVSSNQAAAGIATVSVSRNTAKRAHIKVGRGPTVVIGVGTVSGIKAGAVTLHLRLPGGVAAKLKRLGHVTLTVRITLFAAGRVHVAVDAAGRY